MKKSGSIRTLSVVASAALILGAFVAPADAKKKKKPKPPPPPPPACAPYTPGDLGKDAATTVLTDAATAEAPVVVDYTSKAGLPSFVVQGRRIGERTAMFHNIQVDSANPSAGLYVKIEFPDKHDYDLYLRYADGSEAANSGDANAVANNGYVGGGAPDGAWESGTNYEMLKGINTADCAGYTADIVAYATNGGAVKLSMWLGEATAEPAAPAE